MIKQLKRLFTIENVICLIYISVCFGLFIFDLKKDNHDLIVYLLFILLGIFVLFLIILFIFMFKKIEYNNYHKIYFWMVLVFGILFIVIAPPFMGSDEKTHFLRAYEISEGHFISNPDENGIIAFMPRSLNKAYSGYDDENIQLSKNISYDDISSRLAIPLEKDNLLSYCNCNLTNYEGASLYSPFQYVPHLIGIKIGKMLNLGPTWILYLARICNFLCFVLLTTIGIKLVPKFKLPLMLILLSPVVLAGATTVSADGFTNAIIFLFASYIIYLIYSKKMLKIKDKIVLGILTFFIAMCKIVYIPIVALVFLIPKKCFKDSKENLLFKLLLVIFGFIFSFAWLYIASIFLDSQVSTSTMYKHFILHHPLEYLFIVVRTYFLYFDINILNIFFGNQLYHWQLSVYPLLSFAYVLIIFMSLFGEKINLKVSKYGKVLVSFIMILVIGSISGALSIQYGIDVDKAVIGGIQARYFIPILFLIPFLINIRKVKFSDNLVFTLFILLYLPAVMTIVVRFI